MSREGDGATGAVRRRPMTPRATEGGAAGRAAGQAPERFHNPPDPVIRDILAHPKRIAVIGCSPDPSRDSHRIARLLMEKGHTVVPVNPSAQEILGRRCYPSLRAVPEPVAMVDIFRRAALAGAVVDE